VSSREPAFRSSIGDGEADLVSVRGLKGFAFLAVALRSMTSANPVVYRSICCREVMGLY